MAKLDKWARAIAASALTEEQMDIIDRLNREEQLVNAAKSMAAQANAQPKVPIYWVTVEGIGRVHQGRDYNRARSIYGEYCHYSRQATGSLAGLDVTLVRDGVETMMYFAPRPYNMG
jgi:hypothetical protein